MGYSNLKQKPKKSGGAKTLTTTAERKSPLLVIVSLVALIIIVTLLVVIVFLLCGRNGVAPTSRPASTTTTDKASYADIYRHVVSVRTKNTRGTGFKVKDGNRVYLYTCLHCIDDSDEIRAIDADGKILDLGDLEVCQGRDLVRFVLHGEQGGLLIADSAGVKVGASVSAYGDTQGTGVMTENPGKILAYSNDKVEVDASVLQGNSGGPIVDENGRAIAAVSFGRVEHNEHTKGTRYDKTRRFGVRLNSDEWKSLSYEDYRYALVFANDVRCFLREQELFVDALIARKEENETIVRPLRHNYLYAVKVGYAQTIQSMYDTFNEGVKAGETAEEFRREGANRSEWVGYLNRVHQKNEEARLLRRRAVCLTPINIMQEMVEEIKQIDCFLMDEELDALAKEIIDIRIPALENRLKGFDEEAKSSQELYKENLKRWDKR